MKILITGAAGFIGSNFTHYIINNTDHEVIGLDCLNYASDMRNLEPLMKKTNRFSFIHGNVNDTDLLKSIDFEMVVHFAAETHITRSINDSSEFIHNDVVGTDSLLKVCILKKKIKKFYTYLHIRSIWNML